MRRGSSHSFMLGSGTEDGYILLAVLLMAALVLISLSIAAPRVAMELRRDKEEEAIHRANQYVRAIQLFHRSVGRYPLNIEELENTGNKRFLRKRFINPLSNKGDWRLIHYGQALQFHSFLSTPSTGDISAPIGDPSIGVAAHTLPSPTGLYEAPPNAAAAPMNTSAMDGTDAVIGVGIPIHHSSIVAYHQQDSYDRWQFIYDPHFDWTRTTR